MPLKLTVGLSEKIGQPDYGSLGASCHVEVELDSSLLRRDDLTTFHAHVRNAFVACGQAVDEELQRHQHDDSPRAAPTSGSRSAQATPSRTTTPSNGHIASQKQRDYVGKLVRQIHGLDEQRLDHLTALMFDKAASRLSGFEASALIDQLKAIKAGRVRLEDVLQGTSA